MRGICGFTEAEMASRTDTTPEEYRAYEGGTADLPFTFIHKCSKPQMPRISRIRKATSISWVLTWEVSMVSPP